jgi:hypothetical protein
MRQMDSGVDEMCSDTVVMYATRTLVDGEVRRGTDETERKEEGKKREELKSVVVTIAL